MKPPGDDAWAEAQRRCGLSNEDVRMAKELGFQPRDLTKNIPASSQKWKAPVRDWVKHLYEMKIGPREQPVESPGTPATRPRVIEFRNPEYPWPDKPEIPELIIEDPYESVDDEDGEGDWSGHTFGDRFAAPSETDIDQENSLMLRRQCLFRWAAQSVAVAMSALPEVQIVAAFGAVAQPLRMEVPRFSQLRRHRIQILHECRDLDLAVWMSGMARLKELKNAMSRGLSVVNNTAYGGVAHHQVDVHIFDAGSGVYQGGLCIFGQCPKPGKRECRVPGCGAQPFLQQYAQYRFNPVQFDAGPRVMLFDRAGGFMVHPPRIDGKPGRLVHRARKVETDVRDDDLPF